MKRLLILLMALAMCLSLAACGKNAEPDSFEAQEQTTSPLTSPTVTKESDDPAPEDEPAEQEEILPGPAPDGEKEPDAASDDTAQDDAEAQDAPQDTNIRTIDPTKPMVALTFDDGPHKILTPILLDILEKNGAVATFFEVGRNVWGSPESLVRMEELGCEIGTHSNAHRNLSKMKKDTLLQDLNDADAAFIAAVGHAPHLLRPPYGAVNDAVKHEAGRAVVTWDIDTNDWRTKDPKVIIDFMANAGDLDGKIVLLHSTHDSTVEAMKTVIPKLIEDGYQLVTVSELFANYYGEVPQKDHFYGYTYFHNHSKTDAPVELPEDYFVPGGKTEKPAPEEASAPAVEPAPEKKPIVPEKPIPPAKPSPEKPSPKPPAVTPPSSETVPLEDTPPITEIPSIDALAPIDKVSPVEADEPTLPEDELLPDASQPLQDLSSKEPSARSSEAA